MSPAGGGHAWLPSQDPDDENRLVCGRCDWILHGGWWGMICRVPGESHVTPGRTWYHFTTSDPDMEELRSRSDFSSASSSCDFFVVQRITES